MVLFDNIEDIFKKWRDFNEYTRALVTLATAIGVLIILIYTIKFIWSLITGLRLYVISQCCCQTDYRKKYGDWAVISGATDGIGLSMAKELARRGHSIIIIGRNDAKLADSKNAVEQEANAGEVITVKIDLSESSVENFEKIVGQIDPENRDIGILINNAGLFPTKLMRFNNFDLEYLRNITNVNILATIYLTRLIMPGMLSRGRGLVVNVSSQLGSIDGPYMSVYGPTKAFINSFSRMLQMEYSAHPVDIINLAPGAVHTRLFKATESIPRPTPFNPTPEDYSKASLNAISTNIGYISGTFVHGLSYKVMCLLYSLGMIPICFKIGLKVAKNVQISPVMKRKNPSGDSSVPTGAGQ